MVETASVNATNSKLISKTIQELESIISAEKSPSPINDRKPSPTTDRFSNMPRTNEFFKRDWINHYSSPNFIEEVAEEFEVTKEECETDLFESLHVISKKVQEIQQIFKEKSEEISQLKKRCINLDGQLSMKATEHEFETSRLTEAYQKRERSIKE